jgi:hypothetical protein
MHLNHLHHNNDHHTLFLLHIIFFTEKPTQHIIMVDCLLLAKLSIQNKIDRPVETMQHIKTKKVHSSKTPKLRHPCSLNKLPSPANKWSDMTHSLWATILGFNGMIIS